MVTPACISPVDRTRILRFAAAFLWADIEPVESERRFLADLAYELGVDDAPDMVAALLKRPPTPEDVDPNGVRANVADIVRQAALRAIAADGHVDSTEMAMFELLDDLLPGSPAGAGRDS
jgi:uncharacterized membrane protein YebE (DUF533 family)